MNTSSVLSTSLPLSWYKDPDILGLEKKVIFAKSAEYIGCMPMIPEDKYFYTVSQHDHAEMLIRDHNEVKLLSNICLHRNRIMLQGHGKLHEISCPMHRWSYNLDGKLMKTPLCANKYDLSLPSTPLQNWNGILFIGERNVFDDFAPLNHRPELDISNYVLDEAKEEEIVCNWKIPIEVALENYHAPFIHPGFARFAAPSTWYENEGTLDSERLMYQEMKPHPDFAKNPASELFEKLQNAILQMTHNIPPKIGALIVIYYPNIVIEWWPFMFLVTAYIPRSPELTLMTREFFFDKNALKAIPEYPSIAKAAWYETEDTDIAEQFAIHKGRVSPYCRDSHGHLASKVYQSPMEDSVLFFHASIMHALLPCLAKNGDFS